jgi:hypothetical protein
MVHFPGLTRTQLCIHRAVIWFYQIGFPHSDIPGSKPACGSPRLIAACHVLHRLLVPRHPPYALSSLTIKLTQHVQIPFGIGIRKPPFLKGLAALLAVFQKCLRLQPNHHWSGCKRKRHAEVGSPFHKTLLSSKTCGFKCRANHTSPRTALCQLPSVVKDLRLDHLLPIKASPFQTERSADLESALRNLLKIKNPASSAGQIRLSFGPLFRAA